MPKNPFIVGKPVPPERFVGRTALIETAFDQISHRSNLSVWGGPGIGKSSFLELLTIRIHPQETFIALAIQMFDIYKLRNLVLAYF